MRKTFLAATTALLAALILTGCQTTDANGVDKNALPQADSSSSTTEAATTPAKKKAPAKPKASTCDMAREAILTGSPTQIKKAMKALVADKKADADARESAQKYLHETDKDLKEMYTSLIQMSCAV